LSQVFDSLRARRSGPAPAPAAHLHAERDAVLAMLGFPRVRRGLNWSALVATLTLIAGLAIAALVGWRLYSESGPVTPAARPATATTPRS
jgi:hypothetical protein